MKKILSMILVAMMMVAVLCTAAMASDEDTTRCGNEPHPWELKIRIDERMQDRVKVLGREALVVQIVKDQLAQGPINAGVVIGK